MNCIKSAQRILIMLTVLIIFGVGVLHAQTPSPQPSPSPQSTPVIPGQAGSVTLSSFLEELVNNFVAFKVAFIGTVEGTLGGYFSVLAWILAWLIAIGYFIQQAVRGEWDYSEIGQWTGRLVLCLLLLFACGDVNGDGKRGDLIRAFGWFGYELAYGQSPDEPNGNFINRTVDEQATKFNTNYQSFVENKLMVKINDKDMPVRYPGMQGVQTVAAVYTGMGASDEQKRQTMSQEFWIGLLFQILNFTRSIIAIIDFFLLALYSFGILVMILIAPFMIAPFVSREMAKRFTYPYLWTVFTICVVFPALSQAARYFAYLAGNFALGTSGNPNYTYDPATFTITANGDPTPMILVAVLCMLISILFLAMSVVLSYAVVQGKLVEAMTGLIANAFAGISSVGVGAVVSGMAMKMQTAGGKAEIDGAQAATNFRAGQTLESQRLSAENAKNVNALSAMGNYTSSMLNAEGTKQNSQISSLGNLMSGLTNTEATRVGAVNGAVSNYRHSLATMGTEEKQQEANNFADYLSKNNDAASKQIADEIRLHPEKLDLLAENYDNILKGIPLGGTIAGAFGMNKEGFNAWTRTEGVKTVGQYMFGDPETGKLASPMMNKLTGTAPVSILGDAEQQKVMNGSQPMVFQRTDGTQINALTGETIPQAVGGNGASIFQTGAPSLQPDAKSFMKSLSPKEQKTLQQNQRNLQDLMRREPEFLPTVQAYAAQHNINPNNLLNLMAIESSFKKTASNPDGYIGLGQVGRPERQSMGWSGNDSTDLARLSNMSSTQQLNSLVFPFMDKKLGKNLNGASMATMYAAWGSGHATGNPNAVHMVDGGKRSGAYNKNPSWDVNKDGKVQEWEFGLSPLKKLGAGIMFDAGGKRGQIRMPQPSSGIVGSMPTRAGQVSPAGVSYSSNSAAVNAVSNAGSAGNTVQPYSLSEGIKKINSQPSAPNQRVAAKQIAIDAEAQNSLFNNKANLDNRNQITQQSFAEKRVNEQNFTNEQIQNANQVAGIQQQAAYQQYGAQVEASNTLFGYQSAGAGVNRDTSLSTGQMNYETSLKTAQMQYQSDTGAAEITKNAALEGMYQKNMGNLVQSIGGGIAHQISELFERASRGLN